jgi:hypothetical protein
VSFHLENGRNEGFWERFRKKEGGVVNNTDCFFGEEIVLFVRWMTCGIFKRSMTQMYSLKRYFKNLWVLCWYKDEDGIQDF